MRLDVDKNRLGSQPGDAAGGGEEGECWTNDFVVGLDADRHEHNQQCIGAAGDSDGMFGSTVFRQAFFKPRDRRAQNQCLSVANFINRPPDFLSNRRILRLQIKQFNLHLCSVRDEPPDGKQAKINWRSLLQQPCPGSVIFGGKRRRRCLSHPL